MPRTSKFLIDSFPRIVTATGNKRVSVWFLVESGVGLIVLWVMFSVIIILYKKLFVNKKYYVSFRERKMY